MPAIKSATKIRLCFFFSLPLFKRLCSSCRSLGEIHYQMTADFTTRHGKAQIRLQGNVQVYKYRDVNCQLYTQTNAQTHTTLHNTCSTQIHLRLQGDSKAQLYKFVVDKSKGRWNEDSSSRIFIRRAYKLVFSMES